MSSFILKILALLFMIIDHTGFILFPDKIIFRAIGRLAFPLFAYQMAVGFSHTKDKNKHILKLLCFAIICQIPCLILNNLYNLSFSLNIIFTFVLALLLISVIEKNQIYAIENSISKLNIRNFLITSLTTIFILFIGIYFNTDYTWYGILLTVAFYFTLSKKSLSMLSLFILINISFFVNPNIMSLLAYLSLFDCIFILLFNGKRGYKNSWIFYAAYILHFVPLLFIKYYLI